jgi:7-cyano-7-deazaguanine synthase
MDILILLSGGLDSTACLNYFMKREDKISLLYFNYGQPDENIERKAALNISGYYKLKLEIVDIIGCPIPIGMIPGRNAFLLSLSLLKTSFVTGGVVIGIHDKTDYCDCTENFIQGMQNIFNMYSDGRIQILTPFLHWTKNEIATYANNEKLPLNLVYSTSLNKESYIRGNNEKK